MTSVKHKMSMYGSVATIVSVVTFALLAIFVIIIPLFPLQWRFAPKMTEKVHGDTCLRPLPYLKI